VREKGKKRVSDKGQRLKTKDQRPKTKSAAPSVGSTFGGQSAMFINWQLALLLVLFFSFTCYSQEEEEEEQPQASLADILTDECGEQPDSLNDYLMPSEFSDVEVVEVANGNTIVVVIANKNRKTIKLTGLIVSDIKTDEAKKSQQFLSGLVLGKRIFVLQYEKTNTDNMEGIVTLAGNYTDVNLSMLKSGLARYEKSKFLSEYDNCAYKQTALKANKK
jgi:endonuclease YncB( thermonuclease family)